MQSCTCEGLKGRVLDCQSSLKAKHFTVWCLLNRW